MMASSNRVHRYRCMVDGICGSWLSTSESLKVEQSRDLNLHAHIQAVEGTSRLAYYHSCHKIPVYAGMARIPLNTDNFGRA
jgi:hypothetical protein